MKAEGKRRKHRNKQTELTMKEGKMYYHYDREKGDPVERTRVSYIKSAVHRELLKIFEISGNGDLRARIPTTSCIIFSRYLQSLRISGPHCLVILGGNLNDVVTREKFIPLCLSTGR